MKKLVMLSVESVFSGRVLSGMAEMVDSLANALSKDYEWYFAFGLMVTLVWLYIEMLKLLAKLRQND